MLGKLIKHECRAVSKIMALLHLTLLIITAIGYAVLRLRSHLSDVKWISEFTLILYIFLIIIVSTAVIIYLIALFYKNLFSDEGYLMFTLPVKPWQLILSKLIVSFMWIMINFVFTILSIAAIVSTQITFEKLLALYEKIKLNYFMETGLDFNQLIVLTIVGMLLSLLYMFMMIYTSISIGQAMGKRKILCSFGAYLVLYVVSQILSAIVMLPFGVVNLYNQIDTPDIYVPLTKFIIPSYILTFILFILYFFITNYFLTKKLNLE